MISPWFLPRAFLKDFENIFSAIPYTFMNGEGLGTNIAMGCRDSPQTCRFHTASNPEIVIIFALSISSK